MRGQPIQGQLGEGFAVGMGRGCCYSFLQPAFEGARLPFPNRAKNPSAVVPEACIAGCVPLLALSMPHCKQCVKEEYVIVDTNGLLFTLQEERTLSSFPFP